MDTERTTMTVSEMKVWEAMQSIEVEHPEIETFIDWFGEYHAREAATIMSQHVSAVWDAIPQTIQTELMEEDRFYRAVIQHFDYSEEVPRLQGEAAEIAEKIILGYSQEITSPSL